MTDPSALDLEQAAPLDTATHTVLWVGVRVEWDPATGIEERNPAVTQVLGFLDGALGAELDWPDPVLGHQWTVGAAHTNSANPD